MNKIDKNKKRWVEAWPVKDLISKVESGELDLGTEYQREVIWSKEKKALLIDSILKDIDIPKIYLAYFVKENRYECIDGKQRIASVLEFYSNDIQATAGEHYKNLPNNRTFLDYEFAVTIIQSPAKEEISELFKRLNFGTPLNGGEQINAMRGDLKDFIFDKNKGIGRDGPFIGKVGMKEYRFSREIALAQIVINSLPFREKGGGFVRGRYEDIREFLEKDGHKKFNSPTEKKVNKISATLKKVEDAFGDSISKLNRKSAIVSAYLFCEMMMEKKREKALKKFAEFYLKLLDEMKQQADLIKAYKTPTKKILLEEFQKNLQQASVEGYSLKRRQEFLEKAFAHYLKKGEIIGDK